MDQLKNYWDRSFTDWRYRLILHLGFWCFYFSSWLDESMVVKIDASQHLLVTATGMVFVWFLFYNLVYIIWPLAKKKKWILLILTSIVYYVIAVALRTYHIELIVRWYNLREANIAGGEFLKNLYKHQFQPLSLTKVIFSGLSSLIVIIYIPLTIKFLRYAYQFSRQQAAMEKANIQLQLQTLKSQLNPHFFFNTLNNLQSFIVQNEKEKSVTLLNQLASLMRTSIYEGEKEQISMQTEIALLDNYIAIEKVRFEDNAKISYHFSDNDPGYMIAPFLLLPFIENVFKHGGALPSDQIDIRIELNNTANGITLITENTFDAGSEYTTGGIGIPNVRKRLDHYFGENYQLNSFTLANRFKLTLQINK